MIRILAFIICMLPFTASASVMTFDGIPTSIGIGTPYVEDGITATPSGSIGYHGSPDMAHMDDTGTGFPEEITFSMAGAFDAVSFDYDPHRWAYYFYPQDTKIEEVLPYVNVALTGERNGSVIATTKFQMNDTDSTFLFSSAFENIDRLTIALLKPELLGSADNGYYDCSYPCSHWNIDNVTLSAVPLPASLPLFGAALIGFAALRRFKRR
ncbi:MAG: VPLPA-CTERM sorting domain-containing protein [Sneathiella sp.]